MRPPSRPRRSISTVRWGRVRSRCADESGGLRGSERCGLWAVVVVDEDAEYAFEVAASSTLGPPRTLCVILRAMATIVTFETQHVAGVVSLCELEGWTSWTSDAVDAAFSAPGVLALVAEDDGKIVGAAQLLSDGAVIAYLGLLVVAAEARGRGIGRALIDEVFRRSGLKRIDLLAEDDATGFYESLPHKTKPGYRLYEDPPTAR
jgi:GNAT superfamily N-acetyltransferase